MAGSLGRRLVGLIQGSKVLLRNKGGGGGFKEPEGDKREQGRRHREKEVGGERGRGDRMGGEGKG